MKYLLLNFTHINKHLNESQNKNSMLAKVLSTARNEIGYNYLQLQMLCNIHF